MSRRHLAAGASQLGLQHQLPSTGAAATGAAMQTIRRHLLRLRSLSSLHKASTAAAARDAVQRDPPPATGASILAARLLSTKRGGGKDDSFDNAWNAGAGEPSGGAGAGGDVLSWDEASSWSTGLTAEHFDGQAVGRRAEPRAAAAAAAAAPAAEEGDEDALVEMERDNRWGKEFVDGWGERMKETAGLLKQVREPGARGSYLKDSEKAEMYRLHKENPEVHTVERLAKDYRIMRQRVHAILWLKELEEEEEKKLGRPLDDSVEQLLDSCPEFFISHDREFHVASLPYKADFKVMPEDWDGTARDPDEVHYEISMREDEILYREFVQRMNFNKMKMAGEVKCHKYSRRRPSEGWNITVEKLGPKDKRPGGSGGWRFVSLPDGSSRPLNDMEKMYVKRETVRRRRRILP